MHLGQELRIFQTYCCRALGHRGKLKRKQTNVRKLALEWQARQFNSGAGDKSTRTSDDVRVWTLTTWVLFLHLDIALPTRLSGPYHRFSNNRFLFEQQTFFRSESNWNHFKKEKCVKKSLEKSKIILEEKRKNAQTKNLHKKTHMYTIIVSRSRAINISSCSDNF